MDKQGFRKVDPDRWEFANEGFLRGQKHLLRSICRRKPAHGHNHQPPQQPRGQSSSVGACVEVGKFGLEEEVEQLKRDKNVLMQELVRLRQQQQSTDNQLQTMVQRLQGMEQRQQQMMSFLAKAVHSPGFLAQFVQQQNESNRSITEGNKKRRLKQEDVSDNHSVGFADGQIVRYQPSMNEATNAMLRQIRKLDSTLRLEPFNDGSDSYLTNDVVSPSKSSSHISGATLQEVSPTSFSAATSEIPSSPLAATSAIITSAPLADMGPLVEPQDTPSVTLPQPNLTIPDLCPLQELGAENKIDVSREVYIGSEMENGGYIDMTSLGVNEKMSLDVDNLCLDPDMEWDNSLLDEIQKLHSGSDPFSWEQFLEQDPEPVEAEEMDSTSLKEPSVASEGKPLENGWNNAQHMDLLSSENEKT